MLLSHSPKMEIKEHIKKFIKQRKNSMPLLVATFFFISLVAIFFILMPYPSTLFTVSIPLILGLALFLAAWFFYYSGRNQYPDKKFGKEATSGFLAVAVVTAFFIPTLSLITTFMEQTPDVNNAQVWKNGSISVTINYPNPLSIPVRFTVESFSKDMTVSIYHPKSVTIQFIQLLPPENSIISTSDFTNKTEKLATKDIYKMPIYARHFDEISNKSYSYNLKIGYSDSSSKVKSINEITIPFKWRLIMNDLPWLNYLWIVMAGVVASRFITFIADTKKDDPININRTESMWIAFTFIIAVIAFASFKDNVTLGKIVIFNILTSFAFGFGSQKVLELARAFPGTTTQTPAQVTGLEVIRKTGQIELKWDKNPEKDIDEYYIYRGGSPDFVIMAEAPTYKCPQDETSYVDKKVEDGHDYYYRISAVNKARNIGPHSAEEKATSPTPNNK